MTLFVYKIGLHLEFASLSFHVKSTLTVHILTSFKGSCFIHPLYLDDFVRNKQKSNLSIPLSRLTQWLPPSKSNTKAVWPS
jgi:hypothetical protein